MRYVGAVWILAVGLTSAAAQETDNPFPAVPLPELGEGPITLRVARAINPRFPLLTEDEFAQATQTAGMVILDQFGLDVRFERGDDYTVDDLLLLTPKAALNEAVNTIIGLPDTDFSTELLMLLHLGIAWTNPSCLSYPAPGGTMGNHMLAINPAECQLGSEPAMTPGASPIRYGRLLLEEIERQ